MQRGHALPDAWSAVVLPAECVADKWALRAGQGHMLARAHWTDMGVYVDIYTQGGRWVVFEVMRGAHAKARRSVAVHCTSIGDESSPGNPSGPAPRELVRRRRMAVGAVARGAANGPAEST